MIIRSIDQITVPVLDALTGLFDKSVAEIDFVDVGAGTGIWTRMVHNIGAKTVLAVEPNEDMRTSGIADSGDTSIRWMSGSAEQTGLPPKSADWLSMASSFHWANFDAATREFHRILRPGGWFTALWNPRLIGPTRYWLKSITSEHSASQYSASIFRTFGYSRNVDGETR